MGIIISGIGPVDDIVMQKNCVPECRIRRFVKCIGHSMDLYTQRDARSCIMWSSCIIEDEKKGLITSDDGVITCIRFIQVIVVFIMVRRQPKRLSDGCIPISGP